MPTLSPASQIYQERLQKFDEIRAKLHQQSNFLTILRLSTFFIGLAAIIFVFNYYGMIGFAVLFAFLLLFAILVNRHDRIKAQLKHYEHLVEINQGELKALDHDFAHFADGTEYLDIEHPYVNDLDLFGEASVFQLFNRTTTKIGSTTLAGWLSAPTNKAEILDRQAATEALQERYEWRQEWQAKGMSIEADKENWQVLHQWIQQDPYFINSRFVTLLTYILPVLMILAIISLCLQITGIAPILILWFINLAFIKTNLNDANKIVNLTAKHSDTFKIYQQLFEHYETPDWKAKKLQELKSKLIVDDLTASKKIEQLSKLSSNLNARYNLVTLLILNTFFLWEMIFCLRLEHWKKEVKDYLEDWFKTIGEIEALNSFANLRFNYPDWAMPTINDAFFAIKAKAAGHPLIDPRQRVANELEIEQSGKILLITGSNMAGKSTFLRTVGINIVLAMAGAPVCAKHMETSIATVHTSMRNRDSVQDSASSFYAELYNLKKIIDVVEAKEIPCFFLLDEILKGTNSQDRHQGSVALIHQLLANNGVGLVSTHDLALCHLAEKSEGKIENWCFEVQIQEGEMYFDYRFKPGVCQSMNATLLMKKMGIMIPNT